ncbi:MAG: hypothetical protein ACRD0P_05885 [Stackebrandtia sp.]
MRPNGSSSRILSITVLAATGVLLASPASAAAPGDWTDTEPPKLDQDYWFEAIAPLSADDAWAAGVAYGPALDDGVLMHFKAGEWTHDILTATPLSDIAALSGDEAWAVGYDHQARQPVAIHSGSELTTTPILPPDTDDTTITNANGIAPIASDDVWAAGTVSTAPSAAAFLSHWNGEEWTKQELPVPEGATESFLNSITTTADGNVWAAGSVKFADGTSSAWMPYFDGDGWNDTAVPEPGTSTIGVFDVAADGSGAWATGIRIEPGAEHSAPLLLHWDGTTWTEISSRVADGTAEGVSPDGTGGAYLVGYNSTYDPMLLHYRDGEVAAEESPVTGDIVRLMDVAADPDLANVWITGDHKTPDFVKGIGVHATTGTA